MSAIRLDYTNVLADAIGPEHGLTEAELLAHAEPSQRALEAVLARRSADLRWLVMGHGLILTLIGAGLGLAAAFPLVRAMRSLLYEVNPSDPWALAGATALVAVTALFSCWWPAKDAGRINPVELLRR